MKKRVGCQRIFLLAECVNDFFQEMVMAEQEVIGKILNFARTKIESDVSGLLGVQFATSNPATRLLSKKEFFQSVEKIVLTRLQVEGELEGEAFVAVSLNDAILLGGTRCMLPEGEIGNHANNEIFGEDELEAFGEIASIIANIYLSGFEELYPKKIRVFKSEIEVVEPNIVDIVSDLPFPDQEFYVSSCTMAVDGKQRGFLQLLLPAELFGFASPQPQPAEESVIPPPAPEPQSSEVCSSRVLVIADIDNEDGAVFVEILQSCGYTVECLSFGDNVKDVLQEAGAGGVFLVLSEVTDKGVAAIIKTKSACGSATPLIAAGPRWTRRTVLQAVKYGACDIVVTPPLPDEIKQKAYVHLGVEPEGAGSESG
jgi:chemotaxis protein CheY-P-specific phosphatase CheC